MALIVQITCHKALSCLAARLQEQSGAGRPGDAARRSLRGGCPAATLPGAAALAARQPAPSRLSASRELPAAGAELWSP